MVRQRQALVLLIVQPDLQKPKLLQSKNLLTRMVLIYVSHVPNTALPVLLEVQQTPSVSVAALLAL